MEQINNFFNSLFRYDLSQLPFVLISIVIAFTIHEYSHAYVAYKFGDSTAKNLGRLTLNPMAHIDPLGILMILFLGFGWAKPVPVNRFYFKNPRLAGVLVSVAGPLSNLVLAFIGIFLWEAGTTFGVFQLMPQGVLVFIGQLFNAFVSFNVLLFVFNLLPIPPLDGFRIINDLVPNNVRDKLGGIERYGSLIFLVLIFIPELNRVTIQPVFSTFIPMTINMLYSIIGIIFGVY